MKICIAQEIPKEDITFFSIAILLSFVALVGVFVLSWWLRNRRDGNSPYSKLPLRRGTDVPLLTRVKIRAYLSEFKQFDNQPIDIDKAAICRETGRIFPNCADWFGHVDVDWSFLSKRYPGHYVSWGSLSEEQKVEIQNIHQSLEGFQIQLSSSNPSPQRIEAKYAFTKPGPLYVDPETNILLGWKSVPDTELEVLIVQKPKEETLNNNKSVSK